MLGRRRRIRRGGYPSRQAAANALEALRAPTRPAEPSLTVARWLERWLASRVSLREATLAGYRSHIRDYLLPYLGPIRLDELRGSDLQAMFASIVATHTEHQQPITAATLHRIHATLRAALNAAVRAGAISRNPARLTELPRTVRLRPEVWTDARITRWHTDGTRPAVAVWTPTQTAAFLQQVRGHRLYALFHLVALRGLRRGEACGLQWADLDLDAATATISRQTREVHGHASTGPPKTPAGCRTIALDHTTIAALRRHAHHQHHAAGSRWHESGYVFTTPHGEPLAPDRLTRLFHHLVTTSGLPPVTLHGLRHGAATLALAAGADLKTIQDQLGHTTITLTADTYTTVLPHHAHTAAENTAHLLNPPHHAQPRAATRWRRTARRPRLLRDTKSRLS